MLWSCVCSRLQRPQGQREVGTQPPGGLLPPACGAELMLSSWAVQGMLIEWTVWSNYCPSCYRYSQEKLMCKRTRHRYTSGYFPRWSPVAGFSTSAAAGTLSIPGTAHCRFQNLFCTELCAQGGAVCWSSFELKVHVFWHRRKKQIAAELPTDSFWAWLARAPYWLLTE